MSLAAVALALALGGAAGCSGEGSNSTGDPGSDTQACDYDFEVSVRNGPHAGTSYKGTLRLVTADGGGIGGLFTTNDGVELPVMGTLGDGKIDLHFYAKDGSVIHGTGPATGSGLTCKEDLQGTLTGPAEGDTGDWLAYSGELTLSTCRCQVVTHSTTQCRSFCQICTETTAGAAFNACMADCEDTVSVLCTSGTTTTSFFPMGC